MTFVATEAGFTNGMGGASNAKSATKYRYVLFGTQKDAQHPENSGAYFEYDDQSNGAVNSVKAVSIGEKSAIFTLKRGTTIKVNCRGLGAEQWTQLKRAIHTVFPQNLVSQTEDPPAK